MNELEDIVKKALIETCWWQTDINVLDFTRRMIRQYFPAVKKFIGKKWHTEEGWMYGSFVDYNKCTIEITDLEGNVVTVIDISSALEKWVEQERENVYEDTTVLGNWCLRYKDGEIIYGGDML